MGMIMPHNDCLTKANPISCEKKDLYGLINCNRNNDNLDNPYSLVSHYKRELDLHFEKINSYHKEIVGAIQSIQKIIKENKLDINIGSNPNQYDRRILLETIKRETNSKLHGDIRTSILEQVNIFEDALNKDELIIFDLDCLKKEISFRLSLKNDYNSNVITPSSHAKKLLTRRAIDKEKRIMRDLIKNSAYKQEVNEPQTKSSHDLRELDLHFEKINSFHKEIVEAIQSIQKIIKENKLDINIGNNPSQYDRRLLLETIKSETYNKLHGDIKASVLKQATIFEDALNKEELVIYDLMVYEMSLSRYRVAEVDYKDEEVTDISKLRKRTNKRV